MNRKPIIAGNWKMHKTIPEAVGLAKELALSVGDISEREVIIAPSFVALQPVKETIKDTNIKLAAQNMHFEDSGAFTGEISPVMLLSAGCTHVILGHSERRHIFGESDDMINKKVLSAVNKGMTAILCVGETLDERKEGREKEVVTNQLRNGLNGLTKDLLLRIIIAYEPVWAIGTGQTATPQQAQQMHEIIREELGKFYDSEIAESVRVLYGGSVKSANISQLMAQADIDGALVGGASLKKDDFEKIVNYR